MGTDRILYIRTDGNRQIASGHFMRCLSIAQACRSMTGFDVRFLVSDQESTSFLKELLAENQMQGLPVICLKTAIYNKLEAELEEVTALLSDTSVINKSPIYFLDSYFVTENYLTALRPLAKTVYLDDLQLFDYPVDLLINYDVIPSAPFSNAGQLLLGALYAPLRSQFQNREIAIRQQVSDILITTGGSDPCHFCLKMARLFSKDAALSCKNLHLVIGKLNTDKTVLYALAKQNSFLYLHENVSDMASLMAQCDLAVSAAGTTLYELCALGLPTVSFLLADNQLTAAKTFAQAGAIPCAGDLRTEEEKVLENTLSFLSEASYETRQSAHTAMRRLVDGNGAMRIAGALKALPLH